MTPRSIYSAEPARRWLPWGALSPFLALLFVVAPMLGVSLLLESRGLVDHRGDPLGMPGYVAFLLLPFSAMALVLLLWVRFVEFRPIVTLGLTRPGGLRTFLRGHLIGCATIFAVVVVSWLAGGFTSLGYLKAFTAPRELLPIVALLLCFAVQASVEELIFRGWMLSAIARKFNVAWGVGLSSVIFSLLHYGPHQPPLVTANTLLFAMFACAWALKTNNIWGAMGWHAGWNWLLAVGFQLPVTGLNVPTPALLIHLEPHGPDWLTGGAQGPEGSVACTAFFVISIAYLAWSRRRVS